MGFWSKIHLITKNTNEFTLGISIESIENCTPLTVLLRKKHGCQFPWVTQISAFSMFFLFFKTCFQILKNKKKTNRKMMTRASQQIMRGFVKVEQWNTPHVEQGGGGEAKLKHWVLLAPGFTISSTLTMRKERLVFKSSPDFCNTKSVSYPCKISFHFFANFF